MTLPSSGTLTTEQISQEIYGNPTTAINIPDAVTRQLTGKPTGDLVFPTDFYGKSWGLVPSLHALTVGNTSLLYGYSASLALGNLVPTSLSTANPERITEIIYNAQASRLDITFGSAAFETITEAAVRAALKSFIVDGNIFLAANATWLAISSTQGLLRWASVSNPVGTTVGATKEVTVNYT